MTLIQDVAILVPSCDKYSDLWVPLFKTLRRQWKSCPFQVYLISNHLDYRDHGVTTIRIGEDQTWSANLIRALAYIPHTYVLLFLDDFFLKTIVDEKQVKNLIERCVAEKWDYVRLNPTPGAPRAQSVGNGVGLILSDDLYRPSTVMSVWRKSVLLDVLDSRENAWELEIFGGSRTDKYKQWYASENWNLPYYNLVIKGKIDPFALSKIRASGTRVVSDRPVMSSFEASRLLLRRIRHSLFNKIIPRNIRRKVRSWFAAV